MFWRGARCDDRTVYLNKERVASAAGTAATQTFANDLSSLRIIFLTGPVTEESARSIVQQLLCYEARDRESPVWMSALPATQTLLFLASVSSSAFSLQSMSFLISIIDLPHCPKSSPSSKCEATFPAALPACAGRPALRAGRGTGPRYIMSGGGDVWAGLAIYDVIKGMSCPVNTAVVGKVFALLRSSQSPRF